MSVEPIHPLKYTFGYATGFIFLIGIMIYIYLIINDNLEQTHHSKEELAWIYSFLVIMIIGFGLSYYLITRSISCTKGTNVRPFGKERKSRKKLA